MFELSTFPQIISLPPIPPHVYNNNSINLITNLKAGRQGLGEVKVWISKSNSE